MVSTIWPEPHSGHRSGFGFGFDLGLSTFCSLGVPRRRVKHLHRSRVDSLPGPGSPGPLVRRGGRVVRQGPAKPRTPVQFRSPPRGTTTEDRALSSGGERFLDAEEVRGSNPLAPTRERRRAGGTWI